LRLAQSYDRLAEDHCVEPVHAKPRGESPWPLKFRASNSARLPRSVPHRTA
jgi:hypothetical protein